MIATFASMEDQIAAGELYFVLSVWEMSSARAPMRTMLVMQTLTISIMQVITVMGKGEGRVQYPQSKNQQDSHLLPPR